MSSISFIETIKIAGNIYNNPKNNQNISAIEVVGDRLIVGSDEGSKIKILKFNGEAYAVERGITLSNDKEIDIEGIAGEGSIVYIIGSHSYKRERIDPDRSYRENRKTLAQKFSKSEREQRDRLFRIDLDLDLEIELTNLRDFIDRNEILATFAQLPSKENGIDIEGIAVVGTASRNGNREHLYIGFRAPVLRDNWVPVLKCEFAKPIADDDLMFVNLGGRGFRDLTRVNNGFLILAGTVGDGKMSEQIYFWNGEDCLPGSDRQAGKIELVGELPPRSEGNAEGIAIVAETATSYDVLIAIDGVANGAIARYQILTATS